MTNYPSSIELDALTDLAAAARLLATGGVVNKAQAVHAAWAVAGYGLNLGLPDVPTPIMASAPLKAADLNAFADTLDSLKGADSAKMKALNINWANLIKIALSILTLFLGSSPIPTPAA